MLIIGYEQLQEYFGGNSPAQVVAKLEKAGIRFILGKNGRPFTTIGALHSAMGLPSGEFLGNTEKHPDSRPTIKVL